MHLSAAVVAALAASAAALPLAKTGADVVGTAKRQ